MTPVFRAIRISGVILGAVAFLGLGGCEAKDDATPTNAPIPRHIPQNPTQEARPERDFGMPESKRRPIQKESERLRMVVGALDKDVVQRVVKNHQRDIQKCYERELIKNPSLAGKVMVAFTVSPTGDVVSARAQGGTLDSPKVSECIVGKVGTWIFPEPSDGEEVQISYPFVFAPQQ